MGGLFSGLIGGLIFGGATIVGSVAMLFFDQSFEHENKIEKKLEYLLGFLLVFIVLIFITPVFEKFYQFSFSKNYELWSLVIAFLVGTLFISLATRFVEEMADTNISFKIYDEKKATILLLLTIVKTIPSGLASGAAINIGHQGLSFSIVTGIGMHALFQGAVAALCFMQLGIDPVLTMIGSLFFAFIGLAASAVGGFLGYQNLNFIPIIFSFVAGTLITPKVQEIFRKIEQKEGRWKLNPNFVSGVIVTVIFIVWKELL